MGVNFSFKFTLFTGVLARMVNSMSTSPSLLLSSCLIIMTCIQCKPIPFFFFALASNAFPDIGSVGRIEKKKKNVKSLGIGGPGSPVRR